MGLKNKRYWVEREVIQRIKSELNKAARGEYLTRDLALQAIAQAARLPR